MFCRLIDCQDDLLQVNNNDIDAGNEIVAAHLRMNGIDSADVLDSDMALEIARDCASYYALYVCANRTVDLETPLSNKIEQYRKLYEDFLKLLTNAGLGLTTEIRTAFVTIDTTRA